MLQQLLLLLLEHIIAGFGQKALVNGEKPTHGAAASAIVDTSFFLWVSL